MKNFKRSLETFKGVYDELSAVVARHNDGDLMVSVRLKQQDIQKVTESGYSMGLNGPVFAYPSEFAPILFPRRKDQQATNSPGQT
eukprot:762760-Hanusia_phi.AAC.9